MKAAVCLPVIHYSVMSAPVTWSKGTSAAKTLECDLGMPIIWLSTGDTLFAGSYKKTLWNSGKHISIYGWLWWLLRRDCWHSTSMQSWFLHCSQTVSMCPTRQIMCFMLSTVKEKDVKKNLPLICPGRDNNWTLNISSDYNWWKWTRGCANRSLGAV